jgi:signal transduction histidine kinase
MDTQKAALLQQRNAELEKELAAKSRELEIEAAVERVRARAMAMHHSDELAEVASVLFLQVQTLDIPVLSCGYNIWERDETVCIAWMSDQSGSIQQPFKIPLMESSTFIRFYDSKQRGEQFYTEEVDGEALAAHYRYMVTLPGFGKIVKGFEKAGFTLPAFQVNNVVNFSHGNLVFITYQPTPEAHDIFKRFGKVFDQTYTRFLDLQKAEAQAREAQIEVAVERVRAKALAMHGSEEIMGVVQILRHELGRLNIEGIFAASIHLKQDDGSVRLWDITINDVLDNAPNSIWDFNFRLEEMHPRLYIKRIWDATEKYFVFEQDEHDFPVLIEWVRQFKKEDADEIDRAIKEHDIKSTWFAAIQLTYGRMNIELLVPPSAEIESILSKIGAAFDLAYKRFLDLQKAEAQAREAHIEAGLERVRSRSMTMHKSEEVMDVAVTVYDELQRLGFKFGAATIIIMDKDTGFMEHWLAGFIQKNHVESYQVNNIEHPLHAAQLAAWRKGDKFVSIELSGQALKDYAEEILTQTGYKNLPDEEKAMLSANEYAVFNLAYMSHGALMWAPSPLSDENAIILQRFAKVFEQTYTRFLDLKRAEAQAREAQIELGLERVRARAMAMQTSGELNDLIKTIYFELKKLETSLDRCIIMIIDTQTKGMTWWMAGGDDASIKDGFYVQFNQHPVYLAYLKAWEAREEKWQYTIEGQEKKNFDEFVFKETELSRLPATVIQNMRSFEKISNSASFGNFGCLLTGSVEPLGDQAFNILVRFTKVFDLTYTRFNDLKQAEAQAREAQIELAMERVRARTMAMQKSDELGDVAALLFKQVSELGINAWTTGFNVWSDDNSYWTDYVTNPLGGFIEPYTIDTTKHSAFANVSEAKKKGKEFYVQCQEGETLKETYRHLSEFADKNQFEKMLEGGFQFPTRQFDHFVFGSKVSLMFITYGPVPEGHDIFKRFGKVFEQTYTRFIDLQRAEAQAREAQVQLALERVRARTMAMQKSDELKDAAALLFQQVQALGAKSFACGFNIWGEKRKTLTIWMAQESMIQPPYTTNTTEDVFHDIYEAAQRGETFYVKVQEGKELEAHYQYMSTIPDFKRIMEKMEQAGLSIPVFQILHCAFFSQGFLLFITYEPVYEMWDIFKRFASVFEQTYTRFLDLQRAEAHAREAQIEAAMERLRTRAMTMQASGELAAVVKCMYTELKKLDESLNRCFIMIFDEQTEGVTWWMAGDDEALTEQAYRLPVSNHPPQLAYLQGWRERQEKWLYIMEGNEKKEWDAFLFNETELSRLPAIVIQFMKSFEKIYLSASFNSFGCLTTGSVEPLSSQSFDILVRFSKVFDLSYTRFIDLQQAEAQAREAQIQLALERIRSRSLAMHHSNELKDVVAILFQQLKILGLEFDGGAAIHLFSENSKDAVILVAHPDLSSPITVMLPFVEEAFLNNPIILDVWHAKETGENIFNRFYSLGEKNEYFHYVFKHNKLEIIPQSTRDFILQADSYTASFIAEKNSLLGANSWSRQLFSEDDFEVLKRISKVFEQAYIRFLDLQKAEALAVRAEQDLIEIKAARKKAEDTLTELKSTQAQLIQKEKMASLGELTAGIAHEIQNPLNFVNNFSEINKELLEELKSELNEGDQENAISIANDVIENEQKINEHGRRADAIVKGMLQHSRANTGKKEPTDINALANEYLRLSYHGLRAKDKRFNADFNTNLDESIGKIEVVPQEIGRVLLNLYNNAFYAVNERKKQLNGSFEPAVTVSTKRKAGKVEISVKDNGNGIPQKVVDKIFQPFFTTKPTGQGTGLGLSLSYDIVKAHGGEIKVNTEEGEGAEFVIQLPEQNP